MRVVELAFWHSPGIPAGPIAARFRIKLQFPPGLVHGTNPGDFVSSSEPPRAHRPGKARNRTLALWSRIRFSEIVERTGAKKGIKEQQYMERCEREKKAPPLAAAPPQILCRKS
jgi:hypothetical protein